MVSGQVSSPLEKKLMWTYLSQHTLRKTHHRMYVQSRATTGAGEDNDNLVKRHAFPTRTETQQSQKVRPTDSTTA